MKFTILSILGVSAFRISGVSADCCQIFGTTCPEGYGLADINFGGDNNVCSVENDLGGVAPCNIVDQSTMPFCSGGDVPTPSVTATDAPTPSVTATDAPTPLTTIEAPTPVSAPTPSSDCCKIPDDGTSCPPNYELAGITFGSSTVCGIPIDGSIICDGGFEFTTNSNSNMKTCSGGDVPSPTPPVPAPPASSGCCQTPGSCPEGYGLVGEIDGNTVCGIKIDGTSTCDANIDSSLPFCSGDVPSPSGTDTNAPTPLSTSEAPTPVPAPTPSSDCCMIPDGASCPPGYEFADITIGSNTVCGIPLDGGGFNCDGGIEFTADSSMKTCSGGDEPTPTPPSPTPPSSAGKIGMNVWFVAAAAAAFAGFN